MSLNDVDFTGRMQTARDQAARARHLGKANGRPKYAKPAPLEDTPENRMYCENSALRSQVRDLENRLAQVALNGAELEPIDDFGAEFDRLFMAGKSEGQACRPAPLSPQHSTTAARPRGTHTMTTETSTEKDAAARRAAVKLLTQGLATPSEVAKLAGVSRQLVNHWAREIDWRKARSAQLTKAWRKLTRQA